jgi:hypothetical protein
MDSFTTDMGNAIVREAIKSAVADAIENNVPFKNTTEFWYNIAHKLEKDHKIVRTGMGSEPSFHHFHENLY